MSDPTAPPAPPLSAGFTAAGRAVDIGRGLQWLVGGWQLFLRAPPLWIGSAAIVMVVFLAAGIVPVIGGLATALLSPLLMGGLLFGCRELDQGRELRIEHLLAGVRGAQASSLVQVGVFSLAAMFVIALVIFLIGGGAALSGTLVGRGAAAGLVLGAVLLALLVALALLVPVSMALWFAPALVMFAGLAPIAALKASFAGCLKNLAPFCVYGIVLFVLLFAAAVPLLLGYLVVIPVLAGSIHCAYADIYE
jgi:uncharacterized membrane protein